MKRSHLLTLAVFAFLAFAAAKCSSAAIFGGGGARPCGGHSGSPQRWGNAGNQP
jgi:hypothetical protein